LKKATKVVQNVRRRIGCVNYYCQKITLNDISVGGIFILLYTFNSVHFLNVVHVVKINNSCVLFVKCSLNILCVDPAYCMEHVAYLVVNTRLGFFAFVNRCALVVLVCFIILSDFCLSKCCSRGNRIIDFKQHPQSWISA
jgi:hypothetical protein